MSQPLSMYDDTDMQSDANGLATQPYVSYHGGAYVVHLPDFLGLPSKSFSTGHCAPAQAHADACAYRDRKLPASHKARVLRLQRRRDNGASLPALRGVTARSRMSFGRPGINLVRTPNTDSDIVRATARDHGAGSSQTRSFSVERYGLDTALLYAIRKRLCWERTLHGHVSRLSESEWVRFMAFAYTQFGGDAFDLRELEHRGSVRDHGKGWLSATMTVQKKEHTRYFSVRAYGSKHEARVAAILCCLDWTQALGAHYRRTNTTASKRNAITGVVGVCRRRINDGRGTSPLVAYEALVYVDGHRRPRRFSAGREHRITALHDLAAFRAACAYRRAYEQCLATGAPFDHRQLDDWKALFGHPEAGAALSP